MVELTLIFDGVLDEVCPEMGSGKLVEKLPCSETTGVPFEKATCVFLYRASCCWYFFSIDRGKILVCP